MSLQANANGSITGYFTIPAGVPTGRQEFVVTGEQGNRGSAVFTGTGTVRNEVLRRVTTSTRFDPLAQTFMLDAATQVGAVQVFVKTKANNPIRVQIRTTGFGVPTGEVLAESIKPAATITANAWNQFDFDPAVALDPDVEYALVILNDEDTPSVGIAEMGKYDSAAQRWVTNQPYTIGVLLSSSNASTWTPHQDRDLAFRIIGMRYAAGASTVSLGTVAVTGCSDLRINGFIEEPVAGADGNFQLILPGGRVMNVGDSQVVQFPTPITGSIEIRAVLRSTATHSAILYPGTTLAIGVIQSSGDYVSEAFEADVTGCNVRVILDGNLPSGSTMKVYFAGVDTGDAWVLMSLDGTPVPLGENFYEHQYYATGVTEARIRVKVVLTGSSAARPRVRNLRVSVT